MQYILSIEGESTGKILLESQNDNDSILTRVDFQIAQQNRETNDRSDFLVGTLTVEGELKDRTKDATKEIADWSLKTDKANIYKIVELKIKKDKDIIRDYYLKDMFCVSYQEFFVEDNQSGGKNDTYGKFVLEMRQRKGSIDTIVIDAE